MIKMKIIILSLLTLIMALPGYGQDVKDIIRKSEEIRRGVESSEAEMTMTIIRPTWTRTMSIKSWSKGDDFALILVQAPARDKGTATLKRHKEVWNWVPRIERTIKLPPSMMSQPLLGSDFTNEDLVQEISIINDYDHRLLKDSTIQGRKCWKIELIPHEDVAVVWGKIISFVDQKDYVGMRSEYYDEDNYLVNVLQVLEVEPMGGKPFPTKIEMVPVDEEGHKTVMEYNNIIFDKNIPDNFFSVQNMKRVR